MRKALLRMCLLCALPPPPVNWFENYIWCGSLRDVGTTPHWDLDILPPLCFHQQKWALESLFILPVEYPWWLSALETVSSSHCCIERCVFKWKRKKKWTHCHGCSSFTFKELHIWVACFCVVWWFLWVRPIMLEALWELLCKPAAITGLFSCFIEHQYICTSISGFNFITFILVVPYFFCHGTHFSLSSFTVSPPNLLPHETSWCDLELVTIS